MNHFPYLKESMTGKKIVVAILALVLCVSLMPDGFVSAQDPYQGTILSGSDEYLEVTTATGSRSNTITIRVRNDGTQTWYNYGSNIIAINYRYEPTDTPGDNGNTDSHFGCSDWLTPYRVSTMNETSIAPGQTATFDFWMCNEHGEPASSGYWREHFALAYGANWMSDGAGDVPKFIAHIDIVASVYNISGYVRDSSNEGISGVTVGFGGARPSVTTNSSGYYSQSGFPNGTYTVTPSKADCTFNPSSQSVTVNNGNETNINFTGTCDQQVWAAEILTASPVPIDVPENGNSSPVTTIRAQNNGNTTWSNVGTEAVCVNYRYEPTDTPGDNGNTDSHFGCGEWVSPYRVACMNESSVAPGGTATFDFWMCNEHGEPASSTYDWHEHFALGYGTNWMPDGEGDVAKFIADIRVVGGSYTISGYVRDSSNDGISGVTLNFGGARPDVATDSIGFYSQTGFGNGTYTVTPAKSGYTFDPPSQSVAVSGGNQTGINFLGTVGSGTPTDWRVAWKAQTPMGEDNPVILYEGNDSQSVSVVFTNRSNGTLTNTGSDAIGLFVRQTDATWPVPDRFGDGAFACPGWLTPYHPANMKEASVPPGGDMTFEFELCTNGVDPGSNYRIDFGVAHGPWFFETVGNDIATAWYSVRVITAYPTPPQARVEPSEFENVIITPGQGFRFDASDSFDPDGGEIERYQWHVIRDPDGNAVTILLSDSADPVYAPSTTPPAMDSSGEWLLRLTVWDNEGASGLAERTVVVSDTPQFDVPWFSQRARPWNTDIMKVCYSSIHNQGCTLTSASMIFRYYGADTNPRVLNQAKGNGACPFAWDTTGGQYCISYKSRYYRNFYGNLGNFSYDLLDEALSQGYLPIVGFCYNKNACEWSDHWVAVVSGSGDDPANYRVNDPWPLGETLGKNRSFAEAVKYPAAIRVYGPSGACNSRDGAFNPSPLLFGTEQVTNFAPRSVPFGGLAAITDVDSAKKIITLELDVTSSTGDISRMQIGTRANLDDARWVAYEPYVVTAWTTETLYMRFEDTSGAVSQIVSDSLHSRNREQVAYENMLLFLPLILR